jgi:hypothetical protein
MVRRAKRLVCGRGRKGLQEKRGKNDMIKQRKKGGEALRPEGNNFQFMFNNMNNKMRQ